MIGKKIIQLDSVNSTNNYTANLINEGKIEHGTVILADEQTNGRGQRGNTWHSKPGENVISSIYLRPAKLSVRNHYYLTIISSLSVLKYLKSIGINAKIKWPNDIVVNNKKIAGILIENQLNGNDFNHVIIGIGLNTNQTEFEDKNITSIKLETSTFIPILQSIFSILNELNTSYQNLVNENFEELKKEYLENLWLKDQKSSFKDKQGDFQGIIRNVTEEGLLQIEVNNQIREYDLKEIQFNARNIL